MRVSIRAELLAASLIAQLLAGSANADPTVSMIWTDTTGSGATGGSSIVAAPGDTLRLLITVVDDGSDVLAADLSLLWDAGDLDAQNAEVCPWPENFFEGECTAFGLEPGPRALGQLAQIINLLGSAAFAAIPAFPTTPLEGDMILGALEFVVQGTATLEAIELDYSGDETVINGSFLGFSPPASATVDVPLPSAPGFDVSVYAVVPDPTRLAFAPNGLLYTGRDNLGSGGGPGDSVQIWEIGAGGSPLSAHGNVPIPDPDAVVVDVNGDIGNAGSVLVGGFVSGATGGRISEVALDESVTSLFTTTAMENPTGMAFDSTGRLLIVNFGTGTGSPGVFESTGGVPTALFTTNSNLEYMALDDTDRIFVSAADGTIRLYSSTGALIDATFATGMGGAAPITFGEEPSAGGGTGLYAVDSTGELLFFDLVGLPAVVGTGFELVNDLAFGTDGALYAAEFDFDRVLRLPEPVGGLPAGMLLLIAIKRRRLSREVASRPV
jgi:hypothetical protein